MIEPVIYQKMKKVIFLISFSPKYAQFEKQPRPPFCWNKTDGKWIGIWGLDWGDLLLKALVEHYPQYICEVWQPDLRADKIYSAQLQNNLIHRNFPAKMRKRWKRNRVVHEVYSREILSAARQNDDENTVFMLPAKVYSLWLFRMFRSSLKSRILFFNFLNASNLLPRTIKSTNIVKQVNNSLMNYEKKKWMHRTRNLLTSNDNPEALDQIKSRYPHITLFYFKMGLDFDYWYANVTKPTAREKLGIPPDRFSIVLSQRLIPAYQVDKFIEVLSEIQTQRKFSCYISGHGTKVYEDSLQDLIIRLGLSDRVFLIGFVPDETLREYFIAADLFVTVPLRFAGSGGALKSSAIGTPVLHVRSGSSYEFLKEHGAGVYVDPTDYEDWTRKLEQIIDGLNVKTVEREKLIDYYSWRSTADELHQALTNLR